MNALLRSLLPTLLTLCAWVVWPPDRCVAGVEITAPEGTVLSRRPYPFPAWEQAKELHRGTTREAYEKVVADPDFVLERLTYSSDGLEVSCYLYRPARPGGTKRPVIVYNRGGYTRGDIGYELAPMFRRLAGEGFVVVAPLYRGSDGTLGQDEMGGAELEDLLNLKSLIRSLEGVDPENVFLYGESRGGMMTFQALRRNFPARAAAVFGAFTDLEAYLAADPRAQGMASKIWPAFETHKAEILHSRSVLRWVEAIDVPLFILHGGADGSVSPTHSLELATALTRLGRPYEMHLYEGDNHTLRANQEDRDRRVAAWFKRHLQR